MLAAGCRHPRAGILAPDYPKGDAGRGEVLSEDAFVQERSWTSGMCLMLRRECVEDIGGFDHRFFAYVEDVEFCERARRTGWKVLTVLNTVAHGLGSGQPRNRRLILANEVMLATARAGLFAAVRLLLIRGKSILAYGRRWVLRQDPHTHGELVADNWYAMRRGVRLMFRKPSIPRFEFASEPQGATVWSPSNKAAHTGPGE
jgi:GT2 family glycosyltransferase